MGQNREQGLLAADAAITGDSGQRMRYSYVETYRYDHYKISAGCRVHANSFLEILYQGSNSAADFVVGSKHYRLRRGDIVVIPAGISHGFQLAEDPAATFSGFITWISMDFQRGLMRLFPHLERFDQGEGIVLRTGNTLWEFLEKMFLVNAEELELQDMGWETSVVGNTISLLGSLSRAMVSTSISRPDAKQPELLDRIISYVNLLLSEKITLKGTADYFQVSQSTITNLFNRSMGMSFYHYLTVRRLEEAQKLIGDGVPMERIAPRVGFSDYSTFYRAFKREFGISPTEYRRQTEGQP